MSESSDILTKAFESVLSPHAASAGASADDVAGSAFTSAAGGISGVISGDGGADNPVSSGGHVSGKTTSTQQSAGASILSDAGSFAESLLGPIPGLISGLIGLFGGSSQKAAYEFPKFEKNAPIAFEAADNGNGQLTASDYSQNGDPREFSSVSSAGDGSSAAPVAASSLAPAADAASAAANSGHTFHINLAGLDAQSLMDNSDAIGQAVRASILRLGSISDAIGEISN